MTAIQNNLPPGPYRFEVGETADTYLIFAADDDRPMAEVIYIGSAEDFASTAATLARLFAAGPKLLEALLEFSALEVRGHSLLSRLQFSEFGRALSAKICSAIAAATGKEAA